MVLLYRIPKSFINIQIREVIAIKIVYNATFWKDQKVAKKSWCKINSRRNLCTTNFFLLEHILHRLCCARQWRFLILYFSYSLQGDRRNTVWAQLKIQISKISPRVYFALTFCLLLCQDKSRSPKVKEKQNNYLQIRYFLGIRSDIRR